MQYAVKAIHRMQPVSITVDAADGIDARRQAESRGYAVLAVKPASGGSRFSFNRSAPFPLLHFNQSLLILLKAGLSVVEAIETLADRETRAETTPHRSSHPAANKPPGRRSSPVQPGKTRHHAHASTSQNLAQWRGRPHIPFAAPPRLPAMPSVSVPGTAQSRTARRC
jgi:hypothetical protein